MSATKETPSMEMWQRPGFTLRRMPIVFAVVALVLVGGMAIWRDWSRMFDTTVHPVRTANQITEVTGLSFPPGCQVLAGRFHKTGGFGPSGLWAVVELPAAGVREFFKQPRLRNREKGRSPDQIRGEFGWGIMLPVDAAQQRCRDQLASVRRFTAAEAGSYDVDGALAVVVDLGRPVSPVAYVSWGAN
jgi:hypothetical protein